MSGIAFLDYLSALHDPRQAWKIVYPLPEILLLVLCGTMAGAETFVEIERWGKGKRICQNSFLRDKNFAPWPSAAGQASCIFMGYRPRKSRAKDSPPAEN